MVNVFYIHDGNEGKVRPDDCSRTDTHTQSVDFVSSRAKTYPTTRLTIGKDTGPLSHEKGRDQIPDRRLVNLLIGRRFIVHLIERKGHHFNLFRQIHSCFGLIDQDPSVLIVLQWVDDINIAGVVDIRFRSRHGAFPNNHADPHFVIRRRVRGVGGTTQAIMLSCRFVAQGFNLKFERRHVGK